MKKQQMKKQQWTKSKVDCASFTEANFQEEVLESNHPVLAVFEADWSGTCDIMMPIMEDLCTKFDGLVRIGIINVDQNTKLAEDYRINSIPALFFFNKGEIVDHIIGLVPRKVLEDKIKEILNPGKE